MTRASRFITFSFGDSHVVARPLLCPHHHAHARGAGAHADCRGGLRRPRALPARSTRRRSVPSRDNNPASPFAGFSFSPLFVAAGGTVTGTITLVAPAPPGGARITISITSTPTWRSSTVSSSCRKATQPRLSSFRPMASRAPIPLVLSLLPTGAPAVGWRTGSTHARSAAAAAADADHHRDAEQPDVRIPGYRQLQRAADRHRSQHRLGEPPPLRHERQRALHANQQLPGHSRTKRILHHLGRLRADGRRSAKRVADRPEQRPSRPSAW